MYEEGHIFQEGLFKRSRHPNLFFELATWVGFAISGIFYYYNLLAFVGPIALFFVMDKLTVPITEAYMLRSRGQKYLDYKERTNKYWPFC